MPRKTVVLLSGGLDSSTLLYRVRDDGAEPIAVSVLYGQRHVREILSARAVADALGVSHVEVDVTAALQPVFEGAASSQVGDALPVPDGHYAEDSMRVTVVPNRNMMLLSIATALAVSRGASAVAYAAHAGDHAQYPDCRQPFINAMQMAVALCDFEEIDLIAPFSSWTKDEIVKEGERLEVPFQLTRSCYRASPKHCGRCGTCVERAEAFALAEVPDPTEYEDADFWKMAVAAKA